MGGKKKDINRSRGLFFNVLPVVQVAVSLSKLGGEVDGVAGEQEVVLGGDGESVAHESCRVNDESTGHLAGDTVERDNMSVIQSSVCTMVIFCRYALLRSFRDWALVY